MNMFTRSANLMRRPGVTSEAADGATRGRRQRADDAGFTPAEIIIGVILVGILATGVTIKAIQLMDRARDSAAQKTLRAAEVAAQAAFSVILPGGQSNFASKGLTSGKVTSDTTDYSTNADAAAIAALQAQEPGLQFASRGATTAGWLDDYVPDGKIWIETNNKQIKASSAVTVGTAADNPNNHTPRTTSVKANVSIRAGELIRMGIVAASGSTFCLITVADSSDGSISGDGWQAVNELLTQTGAGADCGADVSGTTFADNEFYEMPGTAGTDPTLSQPIDSLDGTHGGRYKKGSAGSVTPTT